jgi:hypothetical protein
MKLAYSRMGILRLKLTYERLLGRKFFRGSAPGPEGKEKGREGGSNRPDFLPMKGGNPTSNYMPHPFF